MLLEDGRITEVRTGPPPPDAEFIDLPGATLLPGLVDTHVHLAFDAGPDPIAALATRDDDAVLEAMAQAAAAQLRAGVTTVRDLGDRDYLTLRLRESTAALPTIVAAGPPITSAGGHCHFLGGVAERGVRDAVREHAERGVDVIKVMASGGALTAGSDLGAPQFTRRRARRAGRRGAPARFAGDRARPRARRDRRRRRGGVDGLEHCTFVDGDRVSAPDDLVAAIVRRRIAVGATLGLAPVAGPIAPPPFIAKILPDVLRSHARLIREGAVLVAGTDAGIAPLKPHGVLPYGLAQLVALGMSPAEALDGGHVDRRAGVRARRPEGPGAARLRRRPPGRRRRPAHRPRRPAAARGRARGRTTGRDGGPVMRRFLAAIGRAIVDGLATENGWLWAYGCGPVTPRYWPRCRRSPAVRSTPTRG